MTGMNGSHWNGTREGASSNGTNTPCYGGDGVVVEVAGVAVEATGESKDQAANSYSCAFRLKPATQSG